MKIKKVRIRFLGEKFYKGIPKKRFINIGGERFWNWPKFPEQGPDASYLRPIEFYEKHKAELDNTDKFIISFTEVEAKPAAPAAKPLLTEELAQQDVIELDGVLYCPHCDVISNNAKAMSVHLKTHKKADQKGK